MSEKVIWEAPQDYQTDRYRVETMRATGEWKPELLTASRAQAIHSAYVYGDLGVRARVIDTQADKETRASLSMLARGLDQLTRERNNK